MDLTHTDPNVQVERALAWVQEFRQALHLDEYIILASMVIVAAHKQALLLLYYARLQQRPSEYVRQRVTKY